MWKDRLTWWWHLVWCARYEKHIRIVESGVQGLDLEDSLKKKRVGWVFVALVLVWVCTWNVGGEVFHANGCVVRRRLGKYLFVRHVVGGDTTGSRWMNRCGGEGWGGRGGGSRGRRRRCGRGVDGIQDLVICPPALHRWSVHFLHCQFSVLFVVEIYHTIIAFVLGIQ